MGSDNVNPLDACKNQEMIITKETQEKKENYACFNFFLLPIFIGREKEM